MQKLTDLPSDLAEEVGLVDSVSLPRIHPPEQCISLSSHESPFQTVSQMVKTGVWQIVQTGHRNTEDRVRLAARLIQRPDEFLSDPAAQIFSSKQANPKRSHYKERRWEFRSSSEKNALKRELLDFAKLAPGIRPILPSIDYIADELITNAIYNAPFGESGMTLDRSTAVVLDPHMMAQMIVAYDQEKIFVGCLDLFGSLNCDLLLKKLFKAYKIGISKAMNMGSGGAGIGIIRMIELAKEIFAVVEEGKRTVVGCTFLLGKASSKIVNSSKNFHFLQFETMDFRGLTARLEKKGQRAYLKLFGDFTEETDFFKVKLGKVKKVHMDFLSVGRIEKKGLENLLEWAESLGLPGRLTCTNLSSSFMTLKSSLKGFDRLIEVQSLYKAVACQECKTVNDIIFDVQEDGEFKAVSQKCKGCGSALNLLFPSR